MPRWPTRMNEGEAFGILNIPEKTGYSYTTDVYSRTAAVHSLVLVQYHIIHVRGPSAATSDLRSFVFASSASSFVPQIASKATTAPIFRDDEEATHVGSVEELGDVSLSPAGIEHTKANKERGDGGDDDKRKHTGASKTAGTTRVIMCVR